MDKKTFLTLLALTTLTTGISAARTEVSVNGGYTKYHNGADSSFKAGLGVEFIADSGLGLELGGNYMDVPGTEGYVPVYVGAKYYLAPDSDVSAYGGGRFNINLFPDESSSVGISALGGIKVKASDTTSVFIELEKHFSNDEYRFDPLTASMGISFNLGGPTHYSGSQTSYYSDDYDTSDYDEQTTIIHHPPVQKKVVHVYPQPTPRKTVVHRYSQPAPTKKVVKHYSAPKKTVVHEHISSTPGYDSLSGFEKYKHNVAKNNQKNNIIEHQKHVIDRQQDTIDRQDNKIDRQRNRLQKKNRQLDRKENVISRQDNVIERQQNKLQRKNKQIQRQDRIIDRQQDRQQNRQQDRRNGKGRNRLNSNNYI